MAVMRSMVEVVQFASMLRPTGRGAGTVVSNNVDTWRSGMGIPEVGVVEVPVGHLGGTVTITVEHSHDAITWVTHSVRATITVANDLYLGQIRRFRRYVRVSVVITGAGNYFSVQFICGRNRRDPVNSLGTLI